MKEKWKLNAKQSGLQDTPRLEMLFSSTRKTSTIFKHALSLTCAIRRFEKELLSQVKVILRYEINRIRKQMLFVSLLPPKKNIESGASFLWSQLKLMPSLDKSVRKSRIRRDNKPKKS